LHRLCNGCLRDQEPKNHPRNKRYAPQKFPPPGAGYGYTCDVERKISLTRGRGTAGVSSDVGADACPPRPSLS
jgi:hypothetical protein